MANEGTLSWLPAVPYPSPLPHGYWEPVTSTLNWCEEDYYLTVYFAEIVNTFTNLLFMYLAYRGIRNCIREGHDTVFFVAFVGYLIVGCGSFAFHATLKYPMQLVDELSMIYTTCLMVYATFSHRRTTQFRILLAVFLVALAVFITLYYHYLQDPVFHQNAYALLTAIVLLRCMWIMEMNMRPKWRDAYLPSAAVANGNTNGSANTASSSSAAAAAAEKKRRDDRDLKILKTMWIMIACGLSIFLGGFAIWGLDNVYCSRVRGWRRQVGMPWGFFLEGHGWWHLMTGTGAYFYIVWGILLRHCLNGKQDQYELHWPSIFSIPEILRKPVAANGDAKKTR